MLGLHSEFTLLFQLQTPFLEFGSCASLSSKVSSVRGLGGQRAEVGCRSCGFMHFLFGRALIWALIWLRLGSICWVAFVLRCGKVPSLLDISG